MRVAVAVRALIALLGVVLFLGGAAAAISGAFNLGGAGMMVGVFLLMTPPLMTSMNVLMGNQPAEIESDPVMADVMKMREVYLAAENADSVQFVLDVEQAGKPMACTNCKREMGYRARLCGPCSLAEEAPVLRDAAERLEADYHLLRAFYDGAQATYDEYGMTIVYVGGAKLQRADYIAVQGTPGKVQDLLNSAARKTTHRCEGCGRQTAAAGPLCAVCEEGERRREVLYGRRPYTMPATETDFGYSRHQHIDMLGDGH